MKNANLLPADGVAERIVRHFQAEGFSGISEALVLRVGLKQGGRSDIEAAFLAAAEQQKSPPVGEFFELRCHGHFSGSRSFAEARAAIQSDFAVVLRQALPALFFDPAPVLVDDALATGTRYDAMLKLRDNVGDHAYAILLNDPDSSFLEYLGSRHGNDWQKIIGDFETTAVAFGAAVEFS